MPDLAGLAVILSLTTWLSTMVILPELQMVLSLAPQTTVWLINAVALIILMPRWLLQRVGCCLYDEVCLRLKILPEESVNPRIRSWTCPMVL